MTYKPNIKETSKYLTTIYPDKKWQEFYKQISSLTDDFKQINIININGKLIGVTTDIISIKSGHYIYNMGSYLISINLQYLSNVFNKSEKISKHYSEDDRHHLQTTKNMIGMVLGNNHSLLHIQRIKEIKDKNIHPHVRTDTLCFGYTGSRSIIDSIVLGDIQSIFLIINQILSNYNSRSRLESLMSSYISRSKIS